MKTYHSILKQCVILNVCILGFLPSQVKADYYYGENDGNSFTTNTTDITQSNFNGTIDNSTFSDLVSSISGGYSSTSLDVHDNKITILKNTNLSSNITGSDFSFATGSALNGNVYNNTLIIEGNLTLKNDGFSYEFIGGSSSTGNAENNTISILGSITADTFTTYGGYSESGQTNTNTVNIINGNANDVYGGYSTNGDSTNNIVNIKNGTANAIFGGYSITQSGDANNNTIIIENGNAIFLNGGYATGPKKANNNTVIIKNNLNLDNTSAYIFGGRVNSLEGGTTANNNLVYLNGNITATNSESSLNISVAHATTTNNNTLVIGKNTVFDSNIETLSLFGFAEPNMFISTTSGSNNSLEIWTKGIVADTIENFDHYYFVLPTTIQNNDIVLSVANAVDIDNANIGVVTQPDVDLEISDKITLIDKTTGTPIQTEITTDKLQAIEIDGGSFTTDYTFNLSLSETTTAGENALIATVTDKKANEEIKAPAEGQAASVALLNTAGDLIASAGLDNAINATQSADGNLAVFAAISGGYSKYKTGSYINIANASVLTGFAKQFGNKAMAGIFVEAGYGDYSTHNDFTKSTVKGNGDSEYYGLGLIGQYDITKNIYTEISLHGGYLNNNWKTKDTKVPVSYDTNSLYYGGHFGLGYETELSKIFGLDIYGKYFYTHQEGDKATIDGTIFDFQDIDSHIARFGTQLYYAISDNIKPFIGAAWNHEFDGKIVSYAGDIKIDSISLQGDTGILELGLQINNPKQSAWNIGASLQGFLGKHEGIKGLIKAKYTF